MVVHVRLSHALRNKMYNILCKTNFNHFPKRWQHMYMYTAETCIHKGGGAYLKRVKSCYFSTIVQLSYGLHMAGIINTQGCNMGNPCSCLANFGAKVDISRNWSVTIRLPYYLTISYGCLAAALRNRAIFSK